MKTVNDILKKIEKTIKDSELSDNIEGQQFKEESTDLIDAIRKSIINDASNKLYSKEVKDEK